jgi:hypothetical protein
MNLAITKAAGFAAWHLLDSAEGLRAFCLSFP